MPSGWQVFGGDLASAVGSAAGAYAKGCWIASAIFNEDFYTGPRVNLVRNWLYNEFAESNRLAGWLARMYTKHGKATAKMVKKYRIVRAFFTPLFHLALRKAEKTLC